MSYSVDLSKSFLAVRNAEDRIWLGISAVEWNRCMSTSENYVWVGAFATPVKSRRNLVKSVFDNLVTPGELA